MRTEGDQRTKCNGEHRSGHWLGGLAKAVDHPRECSASGIPQGRDDGAENGHPTLAIAGQATAHDADDQEAHRGQDGWSRAHKADPMKAACQSIQLPLPMLGTAVTCLFPRPPARGDALLALVSFSVIGWVMMRGLT